MSTAEKFNNYEIALKADCDLGEGPIWDKVNNRIFWVNIMQGEIHWLYPATGKHSYCKTDQLIGTIAVMENGGIIAAVQNGFATIDLKTGAVKSITEIEAELKNNRFNDGKCDTSGRFWAGTMNMVSVLNQAALYMLGTDLSIANKIQNVSIANGLAWSPDDKLFYFVDTPTNQVMAYDYEAETGNIKNGRVVIDRTSKKGYADGMTIDTEGMLWIALWDGWKVERWNPQTGKLIGIIELPVSLVTSCTFGGPDMRDLYITSARIGLTADALIDQPLAGSLFVVKNSGHQGLPVNEFKSLNL